MCLVGLVAAAAQANPVSCTGFTVFSCNGQRFIVDDWKCPAGSSSEPSYTYDSNNCVTSAAAGCSGGQEPVED